MIPNENRTKAFDRKFQAILESVRSQYTPREKAAVPPKKEPKSAPPRRYET
jgi:hypothetical protein